MLSLTSMRFLLKVGVNDAEMEEFEDCAAVRGGARLLALLVLPVRVRALLAACPCCLRAHRLTAPARRSYLCRHTSST